MSALWSERWWKIGIHFHPTRACQSPFFAKTLTSLMPKDFHIHWVSRWFQPTPLKNMLVKLDIFPNFWGEHWKYTTTTNIFTYIEFRCWDFGAFLPSVLLSNRSNLDGSLTWGFSTSWSDKKDPHPLHLKLVVSWRFYPQKPTWYSKITIF